MARIKFKLLRSNLARISSYALNLPSAEPSNSAFKKTAFIKI
ncbi:hypothetical protein [uncultured Campylobacter sp.]|nr:hypothetical protein [uncultured Campylobacter sp.]